jgi:hypothetical protein
VPLNVSDAAISWPDICRLPESKWLAPCEVLPPVTLEERPILDERRQQYDANQILNELERRYSYERSIVATRRLGIQFISTTGFLLGFARPTRPDCPLADPATRTRNWSRSRPGSARTNSSWR